MHAHMPVHTMCYTFCFIPFANVRVPTLLPSLPSPHLSDASVLVATSTDPRNPASAIIDGDEKTFWITTGLFPQEFIISFPQPTVLKGIQFRTKFVRQMTILACDQARPAQFGEVWSSQLEAAPADFQVNSFGFDEPVTVRFLKFVIHAGWNDFAAVYQVDINGEAA